MPEMINDERIQDSATITGTGEYTLLGAPTGFQPLSVIGANNYSELFVTDGINWEVGLYTYVTGPARAQRTHVVDSSNGGSAVNWSNANVKLYAGPAAWLAHTRQVSKSVAGSSNVTLTALEQRCHQLILTGALTGNIEVIVDVTKWRWIVHNNTSGTYTVTFKTSAGTGQMIAQGRRAELFCDGVNVEAAGGGVVVDRAYDEYTANADLTNTIPVDDTSPQDTEGTQILTAAVTVRNTTDRVRCRFQGMGSLSAAGAIVAALFRNGNANAIAVAMHSIETGGNVRTLACEVEYVPGAAGRVTITGRAGPSSGTMRLNGNTSGRFFGGSARTTLTAEVISA